MPEPKFINLRVHTAYSLSLGATTVPALTKKLKALNVPACAITDRGNLFGGKAFSKYASDAGIKPILGSELCLHNDDSDNILLSKGREQDPDRIIILVKNENGYASLMKLFRRYYMDNTEHSDIPQINMQNLQDFHDGLICLTGGYDGPIGRLILQNRRQEAEKKLLELKDIFKDNLYIEISRVGYDEEKRTESAFIDMAYKYDIPLVATNDVYFFDTDMYEAHDALVCIAQGEYVANENRRRYLPTNRWRSESEMQELFSDIPEALQNTVNIAKRCNFLSQKKEPLLPIFICPDGMTQDEFITNEAYKGLHERMMLQVYTPEMTEEEKQKTDRIYYERLDYELCVIKKMGFPGYFLIVSDFIRWSKTHGVPIGPGRGSGAGSIVAWALKITDLDPIRLDLLFERFLNPERVNMPDFDVDLCQENRYKTIEYVQKKYGFDHVAQIITYGKLQSKAVIRDVARVLQMPYTQADRISKMIPKGQGGKNPTLPEALEQVPEMEEMRVKDPQINKLFDIAIKLEGLYRNSGMHAAGVVIGDRPLDQLVPLYKDPRADMPVTQYDMKFVEETGLIKFDFLGLKTLTVIKRAVDWVKRIHGIELDMASVPLDDKDTYKLLQDGYTSAVFQFESAGMRDVIQQIKPDRFEDLIAVISLYRPGPMGNIPTFINRKHGIEKIEYLHPDLAPILDETYGIMVYQEQVMKIAQVLGGYTLGGADKLRKVMGKKMVDEIPHQREMFMEGATKKGIPTDVSGAIFDQMAKFAEYGFNKSHAAAYSLISYQTAYLKAHYPVEFMCAIMDFDITNTDKISFYREEVKKMGFDVLVPNINESEALFTVENGNIRFALAGIKGVGEANMQAIVDERKKNGKFKNMSDFIHRVDIKQINRKQIEQLIKAGAFDCLDSNRAKLFANIDNIMRHIASSAELKTSSQTSLFGAQELASEVKLQDKADWPNLERLQNEAEAIGFYLSSHPLDNYSDSMERLGIQKSVDAIKNIKVGDKLQVNLAGCLQNFQRKISKNGKPYGIVKMSDATGEFEGFVFGDDMAKYEDALKSGLPLFAQVIIEKQSEDIPPRIRYNIIKTLDDAIAENSKGLIIYVNNTEAIKPIREALMKEHFGTNKVYIKPELDDWDVRIELKNGYTLADGTAISNIRAINGVTLVKEI
ncbi:MAG: DNA polymerase III subunit alpha [Alphaproteobacteria bacterium]|nr:DNA polymerase III subunit alpha [Alphaproteobacteria bacterium]